MSRLALGLAVLAVLVEVVTPPPVSAAGKYDGSASMVCAVSSVHECVATGRCQLRTAGNVNFPGIIRVDIKAMKMILSGAEGDRGWILLINEASGAMSVTAAGDGEGFVMFGQCALP